MKQFLCAFIFFVSFGFVSAQVLSSTKDEAVGFGYYQGDTGFGVVQGTVLEGKTLVVVEESMRNKVLVLSGYRPIAWTIFNPSKIPIKKIITTGYYDQRVVNPEGVTVDSVSFVKDKKLYALYTTSFSQFSILQNYLASIGVALEQKNFNVGTVAPSSALAFSVNAFKLPNVSFKEKDPIPLSWSVATQSTQGRIIYTVRKIGDDGVVITATSGQIAITSQMATSGMFMLSSQQNLSIPQGRYEVLARLEGCRLRTSCATWSRTLLATSTPVYFTVTPRENVITTTSLTTSFQHVASAPSTQVGAYYWGGYKPTTSGNVLKGGVEKLQGAGLKDIVRIVVQPRVKNAGTDDIYAVSSALTSACPSTKPFLPCAISHSSYKDTLSIPGISTFILTTYDSAGSGNNGYATDFTNPLILASTTKQAEVRNEYKEMTLALYRNHSGSGKTFIVSNWETDNTLYCGAAYSYVTDAKFRASCDAQAIKPADRIAGLTLWFKLRKEGIALGREVAQKEGLTGVTVHDAIEISSLHLLQDKAYKNTLQDIVPFIKPAYVTYSAWDSVEGGTAEEDFIKLKGLLSSYGSSLIIGELGLRNMTTDSLQEWKFQETVKTSLRLGIPSIIWEGYPGTGLPDYLLSSSGVEEKIATRLRSILTSYPVATMSKDTKIHAVVDKGTIGSKHFFELYGTFLASGNAVRVTCDNQVLNATIEYQSKNQINVSTLVLQNESWCVFAMIDASKISLTEYGPLKTCAYVSGGKATCVKPLAIESVPVSVLGSSSACTMIKRNMHRGNEDKDVRVLQNFLRDKGFFDHESTGFYGDVTVQAVKKYQESVGLPATGMVYDFTRSAIELETCGK